MTGKILVIEDEKLLRTNLKLLLMSEGYTVTAAADGHEGLQYLQQEAFDLVLTDLMMGETSGFQIMEYVATHVPDTLVIAITGYASAESAISALRQGAYDYIPKPFEIEMLQHAVQRAFDKVQLQRALRQHTEGLEQRVAERTQELADVNRQLHASLVDLKTTQEQLIQTEKLSALGELISGFAHELNNPLTTVVGYAELLLEKRATLPGDMDTMLEKSHHEAMRCHQIVHNLLGFARKQAPDKQYLDINAVCSTTLDLLAYQFKVNNIAVCTYLAETLPLTMVDGHQLQQVLVNLLSNAYQAMAAYRGRGQLTLTTTADAMMISITISDTGPGIAADHLHRIFDPFFTTKHSGTGLGLSLSYGLIKQHGGEITVASTPGQGATFTVALPRIADSTRARDTAPPAATPEVPGKNILVIDDEPNVAGMVVTLLQSLGHHAEAVFSGREAMQAMARAEYDLCICDLKMPDVNGQQVYRFVQQHHPALQPRMIFYMGDTVSEANQAFFKEIGCLFLSKPFRRAECQQIIGQALARVA